jgi:hypothetical protein
VSEEGFSELPQVSKEMLAEIERDVAERWARREKVVRYRPDGLEDLDATALFSAIQTIFADAYRGLTTEERPGNALRQAEDAIEDADVIYGHLASLMAGAITRGNGGAEAVTAAYELVNGGADDLRLTKLKRAVERLAEHEIHLGQFDRQVKGLLPVRRPKIPLVPIDAKPLSTAANALKTRLREDGLPVDAKPCLRDLFPSFVAFAQLPFRARRTLYIENDMCLAEWGASDAEDARVFALTLARQWAVNEADDGSYDHMELLHLTLNFEPTPELTALGRDAIWSGDDLAGWAAEVQATNAFSALSEKAPTRVLLGHHYV